MASPEEAHYVIRQPHDWVRVLDGKVFRSRDGRQHYRVASPDSDPYVVASSADSASAVNATVVGGRLSLDPADGARAAAYVVFQEVMRHIKKHGNGFLSFQLVRAKTTWSGGSIQRVVAAWRSDEMASFPQRLGVNVSRVEGAVRSRLETLLPKELPAYNSSYFFLSFTLPFDGSGEKLERARLLRRVMLLGLAYPRLSMAQATRGLGLPSPRLLGEVLNQMQDDNLLSARSFGMPLVFDQDAINLSMGKDRPGVNAIRSIKERAASRKKSETSPVLGQLNLALAG